MDYWFNTKKIYKISYPDLYLVFRPVPNGPGFLVSFPLNILHFIASRVAVIDYKGCDSVDTPKAF